MNESNPVVDAIARTAIHDLKRHVSNLAVSEVVLALEERRNALPLKDLLRIKTAGSTSTISPASWSARRGGRSRYGQPLVVHLFDGFLGPGLFQRGQAAVRHCCQPCPAGADGAGYRPVRAAGEAGQQGAGFLPPKRVGLFGQSFDVIKLRSMRIDAEANGAQFAAKNDPRDAHRQFHPQGAHRRTAAGLERAEGRDELCGSAPRTANSSPTWKTS
jgi:hypothetical protein